MTGRLLAVALFVMFASMPPIATSQIVIESSELVTFTAGGYSSSVWAVDTPSFPECTVPATKAGDLGRLEVAAELRLRQARQSSTP
ncbi:MAG: hypothetical protein KJO98_07410 [Rhodothermia bacterium]|nr:hypothetical protein [Rhodothermia bacterium]